MAKKTEMVIAVLLDETGSMERTKLQTIEAFNKYVRDTKKDKTAKGARFTLVTFNSLKRVTLHDSVSLSDVKELTTEMYAPIGSTPLYDSMFEMSELVEKSGAKKVLFVVITDGEENSSSKHTREETFRLIESKQKEGWTFIYLGADVDLWRIDRPMAYLIGNVGSYGANDPLAGFKELRGATQTYTSSKGTATTNLVDKNIK